MRRLLTFPLLLSAAALSLICTLFFLSDTSQGSPYRFEVKLASTAHGHVRVYVDLGDGWSEASPAGQTIEPGATLRRYRFQIPLGTYRGLHLEPIDTAATVILADARIVTKHNAMIRSFSPADFSPGKEIHQIKRMAGRLEVVTPPGASHPILNLPVSLTLRPRSQLPGLAWKFAAVYLACLALLASVHAATQPMHDRLLTWKDGISGYCHRHPMRTAAAMSLLAVVMNCYPVIFLGRSFVSPNFGTVLLYERFPTLPGYNDVVTEDAQGSDVGATIWQDVPYSMIQHRALFHDHELPLWNRYDSGGNVLLGQGQSMFGDPLHLLVIAANGAAWAWDLKFLIAKWLFAFGLGLIVLHGTRHLPSAVLTAFSAPFIGFFFYRLNHPAFFSFCYAPWILYSWVRLTGASTMRRTAIWCGALLLSCWAEMNSGTVKEAYMLLFSMSFMGLAVLLFAGIDWRDKLKKFLFAAWTGGLLILISSPVWLTLLETLKNSYSDYENSDTVSLLHPALLLGLFDEIFYRPLMNSEQVFNPSANFLVLCGVLYAVVTFRRTAPNRLKVALAAGVIALMAVVYGVVPPQWLVKVPFMAGIQHIDDCVSLALIIGLIALAGFGYHAAMARLGLPEGRGDLLVAGLLLVAIMAPYVATAHQIMFSVMQLPISPFVWGSLIALPAAGLALALVVRRTLVHGHWSLARIFMAAACLFVLLWRFGQQAHFGAFDNYVFNPVVRADFHAKSPAVETVLADRGPAFRVIGFEGNLFPGWTAVYGLESLSGPDGFMNRNYRELLEACGLDRQWSWRIVAHVATAAVLKPCYDFLNVKYYFERPADQSPLSKVFRTVAKSDLDVYASDTAWPRAFFTDRLATYDTVAELGRLVRQGDGRPFAAIQSNDRAQAPALPSGLAGRTVVPADHYRLTSNTTSFEINAPGPGVIVLQECWLKDDFRVKINGHPAKYLRINHAFKGVAVDAAGTYRVTFAYWPHHFTLALLLSGTGLLLLVVSWMVAWRTDRPASVPPSAADASCHGSDAMPP